MVRANFKPVTPDQPIRDLRKDRKALDKEEPSPERAGRLASFVRAAHDLRELNMAMHAASECLDEDPDAPSLLVAAYDDPDDAHEFDVETRLRRLVDLQDLARYLDRDDVRAVADERIRDAAHDFVADADDDVADRLRVLTSVFDRAFADAVHDRVRFA